MKLYNAEYCRLGTIDKWRGNKLGREQSATLPSAPILIRSGAVTWYCQLEHGRPSQ
jgi:hypothetical protein